MINKLIIMKANRLKRTLMLTGFATILSFGSVIRVMGQSNIRTVDIVRILGCGATFGVFMTLVGMTVFMKKQQQSAS